MNYAQYRLEPKGSVIFALGPTQIEGTSSRFSKAKTYSKIEILPDENTHQLHRRFNFATKYCLSDLIYSQYTFRLWQYQSLQINVLSDQVCFHFDMFSCLGKLTLIRMPHARPSMLYVLKNKKYQFCFTIVFCELI